MGARIFLVIVAVVTALLVTFKLTRLIGWSWWWVLSPLWITFVLVLAGTVFVFAALGAMNRLER